MQKPPLSGRRPPRTVAGGKRSAAPGQAPPSDRLTLKGSHADVPTTKSLLKRLKRPKSRNIRLPCHHVDVPASAWLPFHFISTPAKSAAPRHRNLIKRKPPMT